MTGIAFILILASALMHASWNLLVKRSSNPEIFTWCMNATGSIILLPLGIFLVVTEPVRGPGAWFLLGTILFHVAYFITLSRAYAMADLSIVYPISRGLGSAIVPIIGILILHETVAFAAAIGIALVILGIWAIYEMTHRQTTILNPINLLSSQGTQYALLTGIIIALYSTWDKVGVTYVHPLLYMYSITLGVTLMLIPYQVRVYGLKTIRAEWKRSLRPIIAGSLMAFSAYALVLIALTTSRVSYVAPSREVGLVFGLFLGWLVLKEKTTKGRTMGSVSIVAGLILLGISP